MFLMDSVPVTLYLASEGITAAKNQGHTSIKPEEGLLIIVHIQGHPLGRILRGSILSKPSCEACSRL